MLRTTSVAALVAAHIAQFASADLPAIDSGKREKVSADIAAPSTGITGHPKTPENIYRVISSLRELYRTKERLTCSLAASSSEFQPDWRTISEANQAPFKPSWWSDERWEAAASLADEWREHLSISKAFKNLEEILNRSAKSTSATTYPWYGGFISSLSAEMQALKLSWIDSEHVTLQPFESRVGQFRSISSDLSNFTDWLQSFNNPGDDWEGQRKFLDPKSQISKGTRRELAATAATLDDTQKLLIAGPANGEAVEDWFAKIKDRVHEASQKGYKAYNRLTGSDFVSDELRQIEANKLLSTAGWFGAAIVTTALALAYGWARWRFNSTMEARPVMSTEAMKAHLRDKGKIK